MNSVPNSDLETVLSKKLAKCIVCTHSPACAHRLSPGCARVVVSWHPQRRVVVGTPAVSQPKVGRDAGLGCRVVAVSLHSAQQPQAPPGHNTTCVLRYKIPVASPSHVTIQSLYCDLTSWTFKPLPVTIHPSVLRHTS